MKAVIYARYSCDKQREESIEGQLRVCHKYAEEKGINIIGEYIDRAQSAKSDKRRDFQRMLKDSEKKQFSAVLMYKSDRFARNADEAAVNRTMLKKNGVRLIYAEEYIPDGPEGILFRAMIEGYNEYYSADLALKVERGMTENALKCKSTGRKPPLGYMRDKEGRYIINPETSPTAVEIFKLYAEGKSVAEICRLLNGTGQKNDYGRSFEKNSVTKMLKNEIYIGTYKYMDIIIPDSVPALIEKELFQTVQERIRMNEKFPQKFKKNRAKYLLTGKLYCGLCEKTMVGKSGNGTGGKYNYYVCGGKKTSEGAKEKKCDKKNVSQDWLENLVVDETKRVILQEDIIDYIAERCEKITKDISEKNNKLEMLQIQLASTKKSIDGIMTAIEQGIITKTTKERLIDLETAEEKLLNEIQNEKETSPVIKKKEIKKLIKRIMRESREGTTEEQKERIINTFIHKCFLFEDRIIIAYNILEKGNEKELMKSDITFLLDDPNSKNNSSSIDCDGSPKKS